MEDDSELDKSGLFQVKSSISVSVSGGGVANYSILIHPQDGKSSTDIFN
jgi:hypothetical protein